MKLEVGMYVRTDEGIAKVINKRKNPYGEETIFMIDKPFIYHFADFLKTSEDMIDVNFEEDTSQIKGASHNIIDLIEVGDIIEVENFKGKYEVRKFGFELSIVKDEYIYNLDSLRCKLNIKSIVTKEQFEAMKYKID